MPPSARTLALLCALAGAGRVAAADASMAFGPDDLRPAFLQLWVNEVPGLTTLALVAPDGDVWVPPDALSRGGLAAFEGARREVEGRAFVSLRSLEPELRFEMDERDLAIRLRAGRELLRHRVVDLHPSARPASLEVPHAASAFLNWSGRTASDGQRSAFGELGITWGEALLDGSVSVTSEDGAVRGLTKLAIDDPDRLVRLTAGDAIVRRDALGGAPLFGGLTLARELSLDPYLVRAPLPGASAFAATPSTVDVYLNGVLVRSEPVAPGTYDLTHLPVAAGANDVSIVVRDAFGRSETIHVEHYQAQGLLSPGLHDWAWHLGLARERYGIASFDYGDPLLAGRHRLGVTRWLTLGAATEATPHLAQASLQAGAALPVGELQLAGAASVDSGRTGGAALLAWRHTARRMSFGLDATLLSPDYAHATLRAGEYRPAWRAGGHVQFPLGRQTSLAVRYLGAEAVGGEAHRVEARTTVRLARTVWLALQGGVEREPGISWRPTARAQIMVAVPDGSTLDAGARRARGASEASVGAQRPLPLGPGVGYRVRGDTVGEGSFSGLLQAQPEFARLELAYDRSDGSEVAAAGAAGGLVLVGERLFVTRPVEQSFAVVRVPGVKGVRAFLDHREVGRTDSGGDLLVPGLLPYYASRLSISDQDVPASYRIARVERVVAVPPRGGAVIRFEVEPLRAVHGTIQVTGRRGARVPAYGTLEADVPSGPIRSPIAGDGAFWLEDVPPGNHAARVYWDDELCEFALSVPTGGEALLDLGTVGCAEKER